MALLWSEGRIFGVLLPITVLTGYHRLWWCVNCVGAETQSFWSTLWNVARTPKPLEFEPIPRINSIYGDAMYRP